MQCEFCSFLERDAGGAQNAKQVNYNCIWCHLLKSYCPSKSLKEIVMNKLNNNLQTLNPPCDFYLSKLQQDLSMNLID